LRQLGAVFALLTKKKKSSMIPECICDYIDTGDLEMSAFLSLGCSYWLRIIAHSPRVVTRSASWWSQVDAQDISSLMQPSAYILFWTPSTEQGWTHGRGAFSYNKAANPVHNLGYQSTVRSVPHLWRLEWGPLSVSRAVTAGKKSTH